MQALVSIRDQDSYKNLLSECRPIARDLKRKYWQLILAYHKLGSTIKRYEDDGLIDRRYGDATIKALAQDLNMNQAIIYRAIRLVEMFPTVENLKQFKEDYERGGTALTWTHLRDNILPGARKPELYDDVRQKSVVGDLINFRGLVYGPTNENGVIFLFSKITEDLDMVIEEIKPGFPDCIGRRSTRKGRWERVRIEFEYKSSNFKKPKHNPAGCDIIICWEHDWRDCPLEVIELREVIKSLPS